MSNTPFSFGRGADSSPRAGGCLSVLFRNPRLLAALGMAAFAIIGYLMKPTKINSFTGEKVRIQDVTPEQEIAMGLQSVGEMSREFGGEVRDSVLINKINQIGNRLLAAKESIISKRGTQESDVDYPFDFHVLSDRKTINAFALPGGQVFITMALLERLPNEDAVAGVLGHEIGHVLAQHSLQQMAKSEFTQGLISSAVIATSDGTSNQSQIAAMVNQVVSTKYGREHESESDRIGIQLLLEAGYKPEELLSVMQVLKDSMGNGGRPPEILSSHPFPETRAKQIEEYIKFFRKNGPAAEWGR